MGARANVVRLPSPSPPAAASPERPLREARPPRRLRKAVAAALARYGKVPAGGHLAMRVETADGVRRPSLRLRGPLAPSGPFPASRESVLHAMPRRAQVTSEGSRPFAPPRMPPRYQPRVGPLRTLARLGTWVGALVWFQLGNVADIMRRRDSEDRRAVRLRQTFERVGGTFVKIGQQMASRLDVLPVRYCQELGSMLDRFPPFPIEQAVAIIERATGRRLEDLFVEFDPVPIGSASIACVYQARLRLNGVRVAVKVRRPGIRELFEADFRVLDLLCWLAEALAVVRPGFTENIRSEFRGTLGSELDLRREGRLGELFRRGARRAKERSFTAPRVYYAYSQEELLVQEFVSGMWLWEVLAALEGRDPAGLARMKELNLEPRVIARRLLYANYWGLFSHLSFHADPHPANIVVQANNKLVFIDFGASGHVSRSRRLVYQRVMKRFLANDPAGMAQGSLMLSEPLPPLDVNAVTKALESAHYNQIIAMRSKQSPWYERTSASMYIATIEIMKRFDIPAPQDILMFARASLLYDTLAARLDRGVNYFKEFRRFARKAGRKTRRRARGAMRERMRRGLAGEDYETLTQLASTGRDLLFRMQRLLATPYDFAVVPFMVEKGFFTAMTILRFVGRALLLALAGAAVLTLLRAAAGEPMAAPEAFRRGWTEPWFLTMLGLLAMLHLRIIAFRLGDKTRAE